MTLPERHHTFRTEVGVADSAGHAHRVRRCLELSLRRKLSNCVPKIHVARNFEWYLTLLTSLQLGTPPGSLPLLLIVFPFKP